MTTEIESARNRLLTSLTRERPRLERNDDYFEGNQPLKFIAPVLERELGYRMAPIVLNVPRFAVERFDNRLDLKGFTLPGAGKDIEEKSDAMWEWFQHNDGPFQAQQAQQESLALGRAYALVTDGDDSENPVLTVESPFDTIHEDDPLTHEVRFGLKQWTDAEKVRWVNLYHPNGRHTWYRKGRDWVEDEGLREENDFNLCRLVPLITNPRMLGRIPSKTGIRSFDQRLGRSVFHDLIPVLDALNKIASDMMVSAEFHALPRRWATGLNEDDFKDEATGKALETFSLIAGRLWGVESENAKFGQFPEADLVNFHNTIKLLFQLITTLLGLPADYLTFTGDNPTSADAIRASENQLVKIAERMQRSLGSRWSRVQRLRALSAGEKDEAILRQIGTAWVNAATPTVSQQMDATVKGMGVKDGSGRALIPIEQARIDLGYTPQERDRMEEWDRKALADPYLDEALKKQQ